jgi:hypothetical protein
LREIKERRSMQPVWELPTFVKIEFPQISCILIFNDI